MDAKAFQRALCALGLYRGAIDGVLGPKTRAAIDLLLEREGPAGWRRWKARRRELAAKQIVAREAGHDPGKIDGLFGPATDYAFRRFAGEDFSDLGRDVDPPAAEPRELPPIWPRYAELTRFYGPPGQNQALLELPFPMRIAWDLRTRITRFSIHEKAHDSAKRVLTRVAHAYSPEQRRDLGLDIFGGCLNVRRMRGGSRWSTHSWGIAIDFDPIRNQLRWSSDRARLAQDDCALFWNLWAEEGWVSLGRARDFDWMHVQAARL